MNCEYNDDRSRSCGVRGSGDRRVRAYFAPVKRSAGIPTLFDAAQFGRFDLNAPPAPWVARMGIAV